MRPATSSLLDSRLLTTPLRVLILAYYFPPLGMGGTQRIAKFVKYLPQFGWQPLVVTVKDVAYHAIDSTLFEEVKHAAIFRTGSLDPQRLLAKFFPKQSGEKPHDSVGALSKFVNGLLSWLFVPDTKLLWLPFAILRVRKVARSQKVDCILTSSPPHSVHLAGVFLKKITGLPLAVDFRDGWSRGNFQNEPTAIHRWLNRQLEKMVLKSADAVIAVSQGLTETLFEKIGEPRENFVTITNGFDAEDFSDPIQRVKNQTFTITYCGALTSIAPLDSFFAGLSLFFEQQPAARKRTSLKLVGQNLIENLEENIRELGLSDVIEFTGYLPHREAVAQMRRANLLLYPIAERASTDFIPGKTFEYLASGVPVLAIGPRVEGVAILQKAGGVEIVSHCETKSIAGLIQKHYTQFESGELAHTRRVDADEFERRNLTRRLAAILDNLVET